MLSLEETLQSLRDVDGVQGSFVVAPSGALVAKDLPAIFDGELFSEVGPRIARLYETFLSGGEEMDACVLRYAEHKLYVRKLKAGMVGINVGVPATMAMLPFTGWDASFYGDLHIQGREAVQFYTQQKTITTRWFGGRVDDVWRK